MNNNQNNIEKVRFIPSEDTVHSKDTSVANKVCDTSTPQESSWMEKASSALDWIAFAMQLFMDGVCSFLARLSRVRVSYTSLIAALLLAVLAKEGVLTDFPALEWFGEVILRMWNWMASILHSVLQWVLDHSSVYNDWPIFGQLFDWLRYIFIG